MITVYISIGNSDDKLTQREWSHFVIETHLAIEYAGARTHGFWYSAPGSEYQNAVACIEIEEERAEELQKVLRTKAAKFRQDSIAWAEATTTFIGPAT